MGLIIRRKEQETIYIGPDIIVQVAEIQGGSVALNVTAPKSVRVLRSELVECEAERIQQEREETT